MATVRPSFIMRRDLSVADHDKGFHSFRYAAAQTMRDAGVELELHNAVLGHSQGATGSRYGNVRFLDLEVRSTSDSRRRWARSAKTGFDPGCVKTWTPRPIEQQLNRDNCVDESLLRLRPTS